MSLTKLLNMDGNFLNNKINFWKNLKIKWKVATKIMLRTVGRTNAKTCNKRKELCSEDKEVKIIFSDSYYWINILC